MIGIQSILTGNTSAELTFLCASSNNLGQQSQIEQFFASIFWCYVITRPGCAPFPLPQAKTICAIMLAYEALTSRNDVKFSSYKITILAKQRYTEKMKCYRTRVPHHFHAKSRCAVGLVRKVLSERRERQR